MRDEPGFGLFGGVGGEFFFFGSDESEVVAMGVSHHFCGWALHGELELLVDGGDELAELAFGFGAESWIGDGCAHELELKEKVVRGCAAGEFECSGADGKTGPDIFSSKDTLKVVIGVFPKST